MKSMWEQLYVVPNGFIRWPATVCLRFALRVNPEKSSPFFTSFCCLVHSCSFQHSQHSENSDHSRSPDSIFETRLTWRLGGSCWSPLVVFTLRAWQPSWKGFKLQTTCVSRVVEGVWNVLHSCWTFCHTSYIIIPSFTNLSTYTA